jgi:type IV pilus assembly protein PilE
MQTQTASGSFRRLSRAAAAARRAAGFTLIELMITVAIIGILAMVGYPYYLKQIIRGQRVTGQNFIMDVAQHEEQFFLDNRAYTINLAALYPPAGALPADVAQYYNAPVITLTAGPPPGYNIEMSPIAGSRLANANDGNLYANSLGDRYRSASGASTGYNTTGGTDCLFTDGSCIPQ